MDVLLSPQGYFQLLRFVHFLAGITWIGLLYYFNFVHGAFMSQAETDTTKNEVITKLLPKALWWFRWAAMVTIIAGLLMLLDHHLRLGSGFWHSARGVYILIGAGLGLIMWFNVWVIIWPNQKAIIAATNRAIKKQQLAKLGRRPRRAFLASRINTMLSIPMLFFMGASPHGPWVF